MITRVVSPAQALYLPLSGQTILYHHKQQCLKVKFIKLMACRRSNNTWRIMVCIFMQFFPRSTVFFPNDDFTIITTGCQDAAVHGVCPCNLPDRSLVTEEREKNVTFHISSWEKHANYPSYFLFNIKKCWWHNVGLLPMYPIPINCTSRKGSALESEVGMPWCYSSMWKRRQTLSCLPFAWQRASI